MPVHFFTFMESPESLNTLPSIHSCLLSFLVDRSVPACFSSQFALLHLTSFPDRWQAAKYPVLPIFDSGSPFCSCLLSVRAHASPFKEFPLCPTGCAVSRLACFRLWFTFLLLLAFDPSSLDLVYGACLISAQRRHMAVSHLLAC